MKMEVAGYTLKTFCSEKFEIWDTWYCIVYKPAHTYVLVLYNIDKIINVTEDLNMELVKK